MSSLGIKDNLQLTITNRQKKYINCICKEFKASFKKMQVFAGSQELLMWLYWVNVSKQRGVSVFQLFSSSWFNFLQAFIKLECPKVWSDFIYLCDH